jgi:eukaryotic-like serine/threonine-protein kinase
MDHSATADRHDDEARQPTHSILKRDLLPLLRKELGDRYDVIEEIGHGGMGAVYRARHLTMNCDVAIKTILRGRSADRFLREARLLAKMHSPHVVTIHDCFLLDDLPVFVMEWVEGSDLKAVMRSTSGGIDETQALVWMKDTSVGMLAAADQGITHRDLKPANILIDRRQHAKVADFGLATAPAEFGSLSQSSDLMGTPLYMAPEQAENPRAVDTRADIYSFGATFYHAMTGGPVFDGDSPFSILFRHKMDPPISPLARNPKLSERTSQLLEKCLAKAPADRFQSFAEVIEYLEPAGTSAVWDSAVEPDIAECLARFHQRKSAYLSASLDSPVSDTYSFPADRSLTVVVGDITQQCVDAVVSSDDERISMGGGVSAAIVRAGGPMIYEEAQRFVPVRQGRAVITSAGKLDARFVFHGITLDFARGAYHPSRDIIAEIVASVFYHAETLNLQTLAFPLLGTGAGVFSREVCLDTMFRVLATALMRRLTCVKQVFLVVWAGASY